MVLVVLVLCAADVACSLLLIYLSLARAVVPSFASHQLSNVEKRHHEVCITAVAQGNGSYCLGASLEAVCTNGILLAEYSTCLCSLYCPLLLCTFVMLLIKLHHKGCATAVGVRASLGTWRHQEYGASAVPHWHFISSSCSRFI